jgi:hypothetical protein
MKEKASFHPSRMREEVELVEEMGEEYWLYKGNWNMKIITIEIEIK